MAIKYRYIDISDPKISIIIDIFASSIISNIDIFPSISKFDIAYEITYEFIRLKRKKYYELKFLYISESLAPLKHYVKAQF